MIINTVSEPQGQTETIRMGARYRPMRNDAGNCSTGITRPSKRHQPPLRRLGELPIGVLAKYVEIPKFEAFLSTPDKTSPFPDCAIHHVRHALAQETGLDTDEANYVPEGQPFHTRLITAGAKLAKDVDWQYPLTLKDGVPLGTDAKFGSSPGVWPPMQDPHYREVPKQPADMEAQENYKPAKNHEDEVRKTFLEQVPLGMMDHAHHSLQQQSAAAPPNALYTGLWAPETKETRSGQYTMPLPTTSTIGSEQANRRRPLHLQSTIGNTQQQWTTSKEDHVPCCSKQTSPKRIDESRSCVGTGATSRRRHLHQHCGHLWSGFSSALPGQISSTTTKTADGNPPQAHMNAGAAMDAALLLALLAAFVCPMYWRKTQLGQKLTWLG